MFASQTQLHPSLKRRLSANFLLCGALVLVGLLLASTMGPFAEQLSFGPIAVAVSLAVLIVVSVVLRRTITPICEIDTQLRKMADETSGELKLLPVPEGGPVSVAWNRMQDLAGSRQTLEKLELRLNDALGSGNSHNSLQMLDSLPDGIAVTDRDENITLVNSAFRALVGISADEELSNRRLDEWLPQTANEGNADSEAQVGNANRPIAFEFHRGQELADGVLKVCRYVLFEGERESSKHIWLIRDVTQQKLADEMRNQFLQTATHELRTPLMNICAYAETLELTEDLDVEQQKQFCNIINTEAMRLSRFIDELLDVNRMQAGAMSLARHETDMERLVQDIIDKVRPQMKQKQIKFETKISPKLPKLNIDKDKMAAALVNLLGNAAKYTPEKGHVKLTVDTVEGEMKFCVEDTGIGIAEEDLSKVFDRFFRSDDERVREITGSGLGLTFTNEVVRLHSGRIDVHSELNRGTTFTLVLPIR